MFLILFYAILILSYFKKSQLSKSKSYLWHFIHNRSLLILANNKILEVILKNLLYIQFSIQFTINYIFTFETFAFGIVQSWKESIHVFYYLSLFFIRHLLLWTSLGYQHKVFGKYQIVQAWEMLPFDKFNSLNKEYSPLLQQMSSHHGSLTAQDFS